MYAAIHMPSIFFHNHEGTQKAVSKNFTDRFLYFLYLHTKKELQMTLKFFSLDSGDHLLSQAASHQVPSTAQVLTVVFGMETGVSPERIITEDV